MAKGDRVKCTAEEEEEEGEEEGWEGSMVFGLNLLCLFDIIAFKDDDLACSNGKCNLFTAWAMGFRWKDAEAEGT